MEEDTVYVAVGKDVNESMLTLSWALRNFGGDNFCILHVHQLPQTIASSKEAVQRERKYLQKILDNTFSFVTKDSGQLHSQLAHIALRCCDIEPSSRDHSKPPSYFICPILLEVMPKMQLWQQMVIHMKQQHLVAELTLKALLHTWILSLLQQENLLQTHVYSFGIILLRLDPLDGDWPFVQAEQLANLALRCCEMNRRSRPELGTDVWRVLEPMRASCGGSTAFRLGSEGHCQPPSYFICPIFQEVMQDPHVAADGFTYEREALRGWLDSGHDTSPMTNLALAHKNLVPNLALQSAIQEWLQQH
ncbi:hypothetical protein Q3G72_019270 [Acer saccharum]|nr:hypothetical protein Q3G72_002739 [Acer saccharum]KAK1559864.1 hypothetical protein Q3G72_019270 [Acer saccharum]